MKKQFFLLGFVLLAVLFSCRKSDINTIQTVSLSVQVGYTAEDSALGLSKANVPVKLANLVSGQEYTASTNADGVAIFASIAPSNYTVSVANNYTPEAYFAATGITVNANVPFNATTTQAINVNSNIRLQLQSGKIGDLVFKQIYYAGSNTSRGASFRDVFVEIYNNSNQSIYLDSLFIGSTLTRNTAISAGGVPFDWSAALGMPTNIGDANKDYLYFRYLFMIQGSGKEYPLASGKSIVIAATAINHAQPYSDRNGTIIGITDPALTVDLSKADFETFMVDYLRAEAGTGTFTPWRYDLDNPIIKNVDILASSGNDWVMDANSREDFIIFKAPGGNIKSRPKYMQPSNGSNYGLQVPISVNISDAVEIITPLETNRVPKRLPIGLDATGTFVTGGQYSSQSLIRKTLKTVEGRRILQDTNNSANDFETKTKADPSKSDASFEK